MQSYIGTKIIQAEPMRENEWLKRKNQETMSRDGYKVVYEDGYISWSPKDVFERCYRLITDNEKKSII